MVAIRFSGPEDDFATMQMCDDCLDEQDRVTVYGDYDVVPLPERKDERNYSDFVMAAVGVLLLSLGFITWRWIW